MDARSKLKSLQRADPAQLPPDEAATLWTTLLGLCEQLLAEQDQLRQALAAKGGRGGGRGGRGSGAGSGGVQPPANAPVGSASAAGPGASASPGHSSEAERRKLEKQRRWKKSARNDQLVIDREVVLDQVPGLPADAVLVGYRDRIVQDLVLVRRNTRFLRARYWSSETGQSYLAPLPPGYDGQFGPGIRSLALSLSYAANVSMPLLHSFFRQAGCSVSKGQVCRFVTTGLGEFVSEAEAAIRAAVGQLGWLQGDDTRSGVRTAHGCCHVLGNDLATYYKTTDRGDRRSVVQALFLGAPVVCRLDERAFKCMERWGVAAHVRDRLQEMAAAAPAAEAAFERWLDLRFPRLAGEPREKVLTAAALAGYHGQTAVPVAQALLSDDAALFHGLVDDQALCWIHDFRHYLKLAPRFGFEERDRQRYSKRYWKLYRDLLDHKRKPSAAKRARIERAFDKLVDERKASAFLGGCVARTRRNKAKLLLALEHPELPLHNNGAELAVRRRVRKRNVSFGPVSKAGRQAWDTMQSLMGTTEKLGVSFWAYLEDRTHRTHKIPPLPELIRRKAQLLGPNSWST